MASRRAECRIERPTLAPGKRPRTRSVGPADLPGAVPTTGILGYLPGAKRTFRKHDRRDRLFKEDGHAGERDFVGGLRLTLACVAALARCVENEYDNRFDLYENGENFMTCYEH